MDLYAKQMPHSLEAERSVIGAMLIDPRCIPSVIEALHADDFYLTQNRNIFETIYSMFNQNQVIDAVTVLNMLTVRGVEEASGGKQYFLQLLDTTPTAANVSAYVKIVKEKATLRALRETADEISELAMSGEGEVEEIVELSEQKLYNIRTGRSSNRMEHISDVLQRVYQQLGILAKNVGKLPGIPTGLRKLDAFLTGLNNSDLVLLAARPGMGKTSVALNIALNAAQESDKAVAVFSLEMSTEQLGMRLISSQARVDVKKMRMGRLNEDDWTSIADVVGRLNKTDIYVDDTASITVPEMKAKCRRLGADKLGLVVIDYLQLMRSGSKNDNRVNEVSEISRSLKIMAKELDVPILCLSQLSRATEQRGDKDHKPRLSDLRESGAIEQDADVVMFLYRDDYYQPQETSERSDAPVIIKILVAKNRHGEVGDLEFNWEGAYTRIYDLDMIHEE